MISKHSHEQSERGEGVEVVQNEPYEDPEHGSGQFTEKRIYLNKWVLFLLSCQNATMKDLRPLWFFFLVFFYLIVHLGIYLCYCKWIDY